MSTKALTEHLSSFECSASPIGELLNQAGSGWRVAVLDGAEATTKSALMRAFANKFEFPNHFGGNWDALNDSLGELGWSDEARVLLIIDDAERLLADEPDQRPIFFDVLAHVFDEAAQDDGDAHLRVVLRCPAASAQAFVEAARTRGIAVSVRDDGRRRISR